jgi:hypothetical protein
MAKRYAGNLQIADKSMRARKAKADDEYRGEPPPPRPQKKPSRGPRVRLTHFEIRRGDQLRLRIAVADDAIAEVGDELGALIKKIAPSTRTSVIPATIEAVPVAIGPEDFLVTQQEGDVNVYYTDLREHLTELFSQLCDASLADALEIVREERAKRAEGGN